MVGNRSRDTRPELALRRALYRMGLRYRVAGRPDPTLRRTADLVFRVARVAVFVDGCFWHACPDHGSSPRVNSDYWIPKLRANQSRDVDTDARLREMGWVVIRIWEHEDTQTAADLVFEVVASRRQARPWLALPGPIA